MEFLYQRARQELQLIEGSGSLFVNQEDAKLESFISNMSNSQVQVIGPELIFGKIYDFIGFNQIQSDLFRHLVITRLFHPGSKLKAEKSYLSVKRAAELTHNIYQIYIQLPESKHLKSILLKMNQEQADLYQIILKYY